MDHGDGARSHLELLSDGVWNKLCSVTSLQLSEAALKGGEGLLQSFPEVGLLPQGRQGCAVPGWVLQEPSRAGELGTRL